MEVFERSDPIKERDKTKDDLKEERVDVELCLDNGLRNDMLHRMMCLRSRFELFVGAQFVCIKLNPQISEV